MLATVSPRRQRIHFRKPFFFFLWSLTPARHQRCVYNGNGLINTIIITTQTVVRGGRYRSSDLHWRLELALIKPIIRNFVRLDASGLPYTVGSARGARASEEDRRVQWWGHAETDTAIVLKPLGPGCRRTLICSCPTELFPEVSAALTPVRHRKKMWREKTLPKEWCEH